MTATVPYDTISISSRSEPVFRRCCFFFPVRTGCFVLGYLNLIFNAFHTTALILFTADFEITTHGFEHFHFERSAFDEDFPKPPLIFERSLLSQIELWLLVGLCANIVWLLVNVACLVGLHKKRPGPIKVYIGFASARLALSLAGFLYLAMTATAYTHTFITYSIDLGLSAYFILVYYIYAVQLDQEQNDTQIRQEESLSGLEKGPLPTSDEKVNDITFIYPVDVDKTNLVA